MNKEQRIVEFKKTTPEGILKQFKSDDDIWDFLNFQGEWEGDDRIKMKMNITASSKEEAETKIREKINQIFNIGGKENV